MSHLDQFPDGFHQVPRFQFPLSDSREEICALGVLPSERLVIATELPGRSLIARLPECFAFSCREYGIEPQDMVFIHHCPSGFFLVYLYVDEGTLKADIFPLFRAPGRELTPAHLRQLVGMLPAIRQALDEGKGGGE